MRIRSKDLVWMAPLTAAALLLLNILIQADQRGNHQVIVQQPPPFAQEPIKNNTIDPQNDIFPSFQLLGTVMGKSFLASIYDPDTGRQGMYKLNDVIEGYRIVRIQSGKVTLEKDGRFREILLAAGNNDTNTQKDDSIVNAGFDNTMVIRKSRLICQLLKVNELIGKIKIFPMADTATNKLRGFRIENVPSGSLIEEAGIKSGDIICSVEGKNLQSMQDAWKIFNEIKNQSRIGIVLLRNDVPVALKYEIK